MKISVSSYSFSKYISEGKLTQFSCIAAAKELGFDAIEFVDIIPHDGSTEVEYAKKLRAECERLEMPISNFTFGAELLYPASGDQEQEIERVKMCIRDRTYSTTGRKLRENILNYAIKSHAFTFTCDGSNFIFTTNGYGHGVGMSQTGANGYAANEGWTYKQILAHYYPGTSVY